MKVLVTGANGFVGRNLCLRLEEEGRFEIALFTRGMPESALPQLLAGVECVVHLAGENRPDDPAEFDRVNAGLTEAIVAAACRAPRPPAILYASSIQATNDTDYGKSKKKGEEALRGYATECGARASAYRFPNIFGKWSQPNYNSAVATFAYNAARGLELPVNDPNAPLRLAYVDDVVDEIIEWLDRGEDASEEFSLVEMMPIHETTVGEVADILQSYSQIRETLTVDSVGVGLHRALYATYVSFLPKERVSYPLTEHVDPRGRFAEFLRTGESGQVSFFTAGPGVTRGGHYHHTKTEKFLVVQGTALFKFRNMATGEAFKLTTEGARPQVVDTVPGWAHDITNVGSDELIVVLWANELFDREKPDTVAFELGAGSDDQ